MIRYLAAGGTDTGLTRACNQDSFGAKVLSTRHGELAAAIMCDGMGGYSSGEVASATVVDAFQRWILRRLPYHCGGELNPELIFEDWRGLVELCNQKIMRYAAAHEIQTGTTAAMLLAAQEQFFIMNIGDCRIYEIGTEVRQLTRDQTIVAQEVAAGILTPEEAEHDPRGHILSECIGIVPNVHPDVYVGQVRPDSVFLLCCDGFRHVVGMEDMQSFLSMEKMQSCEQMQMQIRELINMNMQRGEADNISAIAIRAAGEGETPSPAEQDGKTVLLSAELPSEPDESFTVLQEFCYTGSTELAG